MHFLGALRLTGQNVLLLLSTVFFSQKQYFRLILSGIPSVSNSLDPDQFQCFVECTLVHKGYNCTFGYQVGLGGGSRGYSWGSLESRFKTILFHGEFSEKSGKIMTYLVK